MANLVDINGNPLTREVLTEPQTSRLAALHAEFASHPSRGLTPAKLARILEEAERGDLVAQCELFDDMQEKDAHIYSEMSKRVNAVLTVDYQIEPPRNASAEEKKVAAWAADVISDLDDFEDVLLNAMDAVGKAYSGQEIEWELLGGEWVPAAFHHRPASWFQLDPATRTQLRLRNGSMEGAELQPFGWIMHVHSARSGYVARGGLHRVLAWPFLFKNYSVRDLAEFLEIYGLPLRLGKYPPGASEQEKATLLRAVVGIGHDAAGIIPEGMAIEFQEAAKGSHDPFMAMIDWCERSVSKAVLGGTLTSQADGKTSTNALGTVHNEVRHDILKSDLRQLASTLRRDLITPLVMLNWPGADPRRMPRIVFDTSEAEDLKLYADALPPLAQQGLQIPVAWAHSKLRIPLPENGEAVMGVPSVAPPGKAAALSDARVAALSAGNPAAVQHLTDAQAALDQAEAETATQLQALAADLLGPLIKRLEQASSYEEAYTLLGEMLPNMQPDALQEFLARAEFAGQLFGYQTGEATP